MQDFPMEKGLRQGDPLSPYLFVLCMERLSNMILAKVNDKSWKGVRASVQGHAISHLFFADDLLLFGSAEERNCQTIMDVLRKFSAISGLKLNLLKSKIFMSPNVSISKARNSSGLCGISLTLDLGRYLGILLLHSRCSRNHFQFIIDKIQSRLSEWKTSMLSFTGRATLIQLVTYAILTYSMQTMLLLANICKVIDKHNRNFLGDDCENKKRIHLLNWATICNSKKFGGLGLRKAKLQNSALLSKLGWRTICKDSSLWVKVLERKYLLNDQLMTYSSKRNSFLTWRGILKSRDVLRKGIKWGVGDGSKISIWHDWWCREASLSFQYPNHNSINMDKVDKLMNGLGEWDVNMFESYLPRDVFSEVLKIHLPQFVTFPDTPFWKGSPSGKIKLNIDGCARGDLGKGGFGGVFRDEAGIWICGFLRQLDSCQSLEA
ncbi:unnamed protein product [Camellia sinensis]